MRFLRKKPDDGIWQELNKSVIRLTKEGSFDQATAMALELLKVSKKNYGKWHEKTVKALNNLGYICTMKKDFEDAESYLLLGLQVSEKVYGKISREVAFVNMNLAKLYMAKADDINSIEKTFREHKHYSAETEETHASPVSG